MDTALFALHTALEVSSLLSTAIKKVSARPGVTVSPSSKLRGSIWCGFYWRMRGGDNTIYGCDRPRGPRP
eukprot:5463711-Prymnesium_polylepis.1